MRVIRRYNIQSTHTHTLKRVCRCNKKQVNKLRHDTISERTGVCVSAVVSRTHAHTHTQLHSRLRLQTHNTMCSAGRMRVISIEDRQRVAAVPQPERAAQWDDLEFHARMSVTTAKLMTLEHGAEHWALKIANTKTRHRWSAYMHRTIICDDYILESQPMPFRKAVKVRKAWGLNNRTLFIKRTFHK